MAMLLAVTSFSFAQRSPADRITPALRAELEKRTGADEQFRIIITMAEQYDQAKMRRSLQGLDREQCRAFVIGELQSYSKASQADLMKTLTEGKKAGIIENLNSFWIFNGVSCVTNREMIYALSERPDIAYIASDEICNMLPENHSSIKNGHKQANLTKSSNSGGEPEIAWNVKQVHADEVWAMGIDGSGVIVAVIDTGVNYLHPDLAGDSEHPTRMWDGGDAFPHHGYDYVNNDNNPMDDNGHGTHCAGTIAGMGLSGIKTGMAPGATIMALKALSEVGSGGQDAIISCITFAVEHGADVISMSLGGHGNWLSNLLQYQDQYRQTFENVFNAGVVAVIAAGNEGEQKDLFHSQLGSILDPIAYYSAPENVGAPGNCPPPWLNPDQPLADGITNPGHTAVITIGASNRNDRKATFSSFGPVKWDGISTSYSDYPYSTISSENKPGLIKPDVLVPGTDITSCLYSYYHQKDAASSVNDTTTRQTRVPYVAECGTSMATPGAAGIVALMIDAMNQHHPNPTLTNNDPENPVYDYSACQAFVARIDELLETTALPVDYRITKNNTTGAGRADAKAVVNAILTSASKPGAITATTTGAGVGRVNLTWSATPTRDEVGYAIYRDCVQVGTSSTTSYTDVDPGVGKHFYYVCAIDAEGHQSLRSDVYEFYFSNPYATVNDVCITWDGQNANLEWNSSNEMEAELYYSDQPYTAFGGTAKTMRWGICFNPEQLRSYKGMIIDKVSIPVYTTGIVYSLNIYRGTTDGNSAGSTVFEDSFTPTSGNWQYQTLELGKDPTHYGNYDFKGYKLDDIDQDLWITFKATTVTTGYPVVVGKYEGPSSNCLYLASGGTDNTTVWSHVPDFGDDYNYAACIKVHLTRPDGTASFDITCPNGATPGNSTVNNYIHENPTLVTGDNEYTITAHFTDGNNQSYQSIPKTAKIVNVNTSEYAATVSNSGPIEIDKTMVYVVRENTTLTADNITSTDANRLFIEDGSQFVTSRAVSGTVQKSIPGFSGVGWKFIASPVSTSLNPMSVTNLINTNDPDYGLFYYDEDRHYWINYKDENVSFNIEPKKGYLYSNTGTQIAFAGPLQPSDAEVKVDLSYSANHASSNTTNDHPGFNLVGNPFPCNAYTDKSYFVTEYDATSTNDSHTKLRAVAASANQAIAPGSGIMVQATGTGEKVGFQKTSYGNSAKGIMNIAVMRNVVSKDGASSAVADNAIVSFNEGDELEKFVFNAEDAKLYIPQGNKEYAIAVSELEGEVPVNFAAAEDGSYTLNVKPENVEFTYLHLIDNKTGVDTDLLQTPSYTFNASVTDYESRFRLLFSTDEANEDDDDDAFAFFNGSEWVITHQGDATLQVVDMLGRVLASEEGARTVSTSNLAPGMYVLRLVNGENIMTQKIVVR